MNTVEILSVIFLFVIVVSSLDHQYNLRKKKIDAALRMREMDMGFPPGTYSDLPKHGHHSRKHKTMPDQEPFTAWKQGADRSELKKGISDLQQRLANLETIMKSRKEKASDLNDKEWKE